MAAQNDTPPTLESLKKQFGLELYEASGVMDVRPPTPAELIEMAEKWFAKHNQAIREALENNERIHELAYGSKARDQRRIAALVLDALSTSITGFPLSTAAVLITHYYLDNYVGAQRRSDQQGDKDLRA